MTILPEEAEVQVTTIRTMRLELDEDQVREIIKIWAKSRGFSHRVEIEIDCCQDSFIRSVNLTESIAA